MPSAVRIVAVLLLAQACVPLEETTSGTTTTVAVVDYFFSPATDTLIAGVGDTSTVTFTWATPSNGHMIVWDSAGQGGLADPAIALPPSSNLTFEGNFVVTLAPATYWYHCERHAPFDENQVRTGMLGTITVKPHSAGQGSIVGGL
jgi:FtsP/CotA-like multicopper oxidase with cupredoxin domain